MCEPFAYGGLAGQPFFRSITIIGRKTGKAAK